MTISLHGVDEALESEDKLLERLKRTLDWKFRERERGEQELQEASESQEVGAPPEAH